MLVRLVKVSLQKRFNRVPSGLGWGLNEVANFSRNLVDCFLVVCGGFGSPFHRGLSEPVVDDSASSPVTPRVHQGGRKR